MSNLDLSKTHQHKLEQIMQKLNKLCSISTSTTIKKKETWKQNTTIRLKKTTKESRVFKNSKSWKHKIKIGGKKR